MKRLVVGTAGHIDHGKTALVKALTGIDTDRLKEEKARGITIELGFAHATLPSGQRLAFVDVPGHERLIRTMIAGAAGMDVVLLVIAADEGVMPQTREHLAILEFLGVRHGAVVLSRTDLVDEELLELALEDVRDLLAGTVLEHSPVIPVSSVTGDGLDRLIAVLESFGRDVEDRSASGPFRMPIDRAFSLKGFGTVVTGTILSGGISPGRTVEIVPAGIRSRVRGIHTHGEEVGEALAGQRAAINLQGIEKRLLHRGDQLVDVDCATVSSIVDVNYQHLVDSDIPLTHRMRIRLLCGTTEVNGVAHLLTDEPVDAGQSAFLQLRLDAPAAIWAGDRFILRRETPVTTLGGGVILDPSPIKHRRKNRADAIRRLSALAEGDLHAQARTWLDVAGPGGAKVDLLAKRFHRPKEVIRDALMGLVDTHEAVSVDADAQVFIGREHLDEVRAELLQVLERWHETWPLRLGAPRAELRSRRKVIPEAVVAGALDSLLQDGEVVFERDLFRLRSFHIQPRDVDVRLGETLLNLLEAAGLAAPLVSELIETTGEEEERILEILNFLALDDRVRRIREGYWVASGHLDRFQKTLTDYLVAHGEMSPTDFKNLSGLSRKWAIPLLEYFDKIQVTLRVGDRRRLRRAPGAYPPR